MMNKEEFKTTKSRVMLLMEKVPKTRKNYKLLLLLYWQVFDGIQFPKEIISQILKEATQPETISRSKRKNSNLLLDSNEIIEEIKSFIDLINK